MNSLETDMHAQLNYAARDIQLDAGKSIKLDYTSVLGYHFRYHLVILLQYIILYIKYKFITLHIIYRITLKEEPVLRKNKSYEIIDAIKGGVRFVNEKLKKLNNDYQQQKALYEDHQKNVVIEIIKIAGNVTA